MGQVLIPRPNVSSPLEFADNADWNSLIEANRYNYLDLEGDYPSVGPGGRQAGDPGSYTPDPNITPGPIPDNPGYERLDAILNNVLAQDWKERGNPGNPRILECYKVCGNNYTRDQSAMAYAWCAAFVSWALETAGIDSLRSMSSQAYNSYGGEVDWRDRSNIRKWDIVVFKSKTRGGGHIGFIKEITSNGVIKVLGGNQGNDAKISNYSFDSRSQYVKSIKRNWAVPPEFDVPIDGTAAATAGNDSTV
jgi:hypothetical protein